MVTRGPDPQTQQHPQTQSHNENDSDQPGQPPNHKINGVNNHEAPQPSTPCSDQDTQRKDGAREEGGGKGEDEGGGGGPGHAAHSNHHPNGWSNNGPPNTTPHNMNNKPPQIRSHSSNRAPQGHLEGGVGPPRDPREQPREQQENVVLRRGFVPRTVPERVAQRKSSMAQLQQWVNQRRCMTSQEDINRYTRGQREKHNTLYH